MACAGYLVRNNTTVVYAEIVNGKLVCTAAAQHRFNMTTAPGEEEEANAPVNSSCASASLPLLAPKPMRRASSSIVDKLKRRASDASIQPEDEPTEYDEENHDDKTRQQPATVDEAPRVLQLSGHVVDVIDCADEADYDRIVELMPFSFRVKTQRMTLHADASCSFTPVDTLLLAAVDQTTKNEWMKRLSKWSRYGWRETTMLAATEEDVDLLELALQRWRDSEASSVMKPAAFLFGYATAATTRASMSRRRFYRHTGSISSGYAPVDASCPDDESAWYQMRVVKAHI